MLSQLLANLRQLYHVYPGISYRSMWEKEHIRIKSRSDVGYDWAQRGMVIHRAMALTTGQGHLPLFLILDLSNTEIGMLQ